MIDHGTLMRLVEAGAVRSATVVGQSGGWCVLVKYGMIERALAAQRSRQVRVFRKFETLVAYLKTLGIASFQVNAANWSPDSLLAPRTRPDTSAALRRAHQAAAHDKAVKEAVQVAMLDPGQPMADDQVREHFAGRRAELRTRIERETL